MNTRQSGDEKHQPGEPGTTPIASDAPWQRLHSRMIWVDVFQSLLALMPTVLAVWIFNIGNLFPVIAITVFGVTSAASDAWRWVFTRYRVTDEYVERRTGVFVRSYRSVRRDRIRSVDIKAKLRHRLAGLRVVNIGAGQQSSAGESAFELDAVLKPDAEALRQLLLQNKRTPAAATSRPSAAKTASTTDDSTADGQVLARLRPYWVIFNVFNIWAYVMALGLLWGGYWIIGMFGFDTAGFVGGLLDWEALGWGWTIAIGVVAIGIFGAAGMGVNFFIEYWKFELARVQGEKGTLLRTRQGLFTTREITRDDNRMRGIQISEPVLWRWMGAADTTVITTGLDERSLSQPTAVLPRGPISVARPVAAAVLGTENSPLEAPLRRHPRAALRRRLWWATASTIVITGLLTWLAATGVIPAGAVWAGAALWPFALGAAVIAYRALGHAIAGEYVVMRSGLLSRATTALKRPAVSTIAISESPLQRRLGLKTVSAMTAAGYGAYEAPDLDAKEAVSFAAQAAPGLLDPFLEPIPK